MLSERKNFYPQTDEQFLDFTFIFGNNDQSTVYSTIFMSILELIAIFKEKVDFRNNLLNLLEQLDHYDLEISTQGSIAEYIKPIINKIADSESVSLSIFYAHWYLDQNDIHFHYGRALKTILYKAFYNDQYSYCQVFNNSFDNFDVILAKIASLFKICIKLTDDTSKEFKTIEESIECPIIFLKKYSNNSYWIMYHKDVIAYLNNPNPSMLDRYPFINKRVERPLPPAPSAPSAAPSAPSAQSAPSANPHNQSECLKAEPPLKLQEPAKKSQEKVCREEQPKPVRPKLNLEASPSQIFSEIKTKFELLYSASSNVPIDRSKKKRPELKLVPVVKKSTSSNPKPANYPLEQPPIFPLTNIVQNNIPGQILNRPVSRGPQISNATPPTVLVRPSTAVPLSGKQQALSPPPSILANLNAPNRANFQTNPNLPQYTINAPPQGTMMFNVPNQANFKTNPNLAQSTMNGLSQGTMMFNAPNHANFQTNPNLLQQTMNGPPQGAMMFNLPPNIQAASHAMFNQPGQTVNYNIAQPYNHK